MTEEKKPGRLRVLKIPVPNSNHWFIRVKGHVVEFLEFHAQVFQDAQGIVLSKGETQMKILICVWALIIETDDQLEENHEFVMVRTGEDFPMIDGNVQYVASTLVPLPADQLELHLFHAGINDEMANIEIPMGGPDGKPE